MIKFGMEISKAALLFSKYYLIVGFFKRFSQGNKGVSTLKIPWEHTAGITAQFFHGIAKFYFFFIDWIKNEEGSFAQNEKITTFRYNMRIAWCNKKYT